LHEGAVRTRSAHALDPSARRLAVPPATYCDRARTHACTCAACPGGRWGLRLRPGAGWMDGGVRVRRRAPGLPPGHWPPAEQSKRSSMDAQMGAGQPRRASRGASGLGYHLVLRELSGSLDIGPLASLKKINRNTIPANLLSEKNIIPPEKK